jgi:cysteinyl-tRNA synthetase
MHNGLMRAADAGKLGGRAEREQQEATIDTKISRSKGAGGLADLIGRQGGQTIRFFLLRSHYRSTIVFGDQGLQETKTALETFHRFFERYQRVTGGSFYELQAATRREDGQFDSDGDPLLTQVAERRDAFLAKMDDDFNTGAAISELFELLRVLNKAVDEHQLEDPSARTEAALAAFRRGVQTLRELTALLGMFTQRPQEASQNGSELLGQLLDLLVEVRTDARAAKNFAMADKIRDSLTELGVTLEDRKEGTAWRLS